VEIKRASELIGGAGGIMERIEGEIIIEDFIILLCQASPLAWCAGQGMNHASEWEQRAVVQIRRATEFLKVAQQQATAKGTQCRKKKKRGTAAI
jgi:hypothetical protein